MTIEEVINLKKNIKIIFLTTFTLILFTVLLVGIYLSIQIINKWQELSFAYTHPSLVQVLRQSYASDSAQLEQKFLIREKTADDKLKEALVEELSGSKR